MDAVFPAMIGLGLWLCYEAWVHPKPHPVQKALHALGAGAAPNEDANSVVTPALYTGGYGAPAVVTNPDGTTATVTLPQGVSVAGGGTGALHG